MQYENYRRISSDRAVQPLGLVRDNGVWFLAAFCLLRQDLRLFRADRIANLHKTQVVFERPAQFDVGDFTKERLQTTPARFNTEVWLAVSPETIRYELVPPRAKLTVEDGGMVLRYGVNNLERHAARLLEFQCGMEIRQPPELRQAFRTLAVRAMSVFEQPIAQ